ncbi:hypothetical protein KP509_33G055900 [Ceratopteris richardii]|uniref:Transcription initiation factor TFIID component TAF4 C-terminal domain-containing protein n=1 Tax=Ceratopteris richardii TaxID=49495 RepID=A0A8T2QR04_CERRI|nr:hypothetical protein KP509_33G055900 [Ceratopteris richardii]
MPPRKKRSKKQNITGHIPAQSIEQLNDVTIIGGVNLREEEQLLAGMKDESRSNKAMRWFAQQEEGRLLLEKGTLRAKVNAIARHGISAVSEEAQHCLLMSVEEHLRSMLYKLTKIADRRCDQEKEMHNLVVTSCIQKEIVSIQRRAKELYQTRQALESERSRKLNEEKGKASQSSGTSKQHGTTLETKEKKGNKGKQRASAASMAPASANDMLLKWEMMAEQGRQKREVESGEAEVVRGLGDLTRVLNQPKKPTHAITVKDVIDFFEAEKQMAKSSLLYRFQNIVHSRK